MLFFLRPLDETREFVEQYDPSPVTVKAGENATLVVLRAKRQNAYITGIHIKPADPMNSRVIVASIDDESPKLVNVYLRNLDPLNNYDVMISYVESVF